MIHLSMPSKGNSGQKKVPKLHKNRGIDDEKVSSTRNKTRCDSLEKIMEVEKTVEHTGTEESSKRSETYARSR